MVMTAGGASAPGSPPAAGDKPAAGNEPAAVATAPRDYRVALPDGWVEIPVDERADAAIAEMLAMRFLGLPEPQRTQLRREARQELLTAVARAKERGGLALYLIVEPVHGVALSASIVVCYLAAGGPIAVEDLLADFRDEQSDELSVRPVAGVQALRRRRRSPATEDGAGGIEPVHVEYVIPIPHGDAHLLVSCVTTTEPVIEPLVALFDAIVATLEWVA